MVGQLPGAAHDHLVVLDQQRGQGLGAHRVGHRAERAEASIDQRGEALVSDDGIDDGAERGRRVRPHGVEELRLGQVALDPGEEVDELGTRLVLADRDERAQRQALERPGLVGVQ